MIKEKRRRREPPVLYRQIDPAGPTPGDIVYDPCGNFRIGIEGGRIVAELTGTRSGETPGATFFTPSSPGGTSRCSIMRHTWEKNSIRRNLPSGSGGASNRTGRSECPLHHGLSYIPPNVLPAMHIRGISRELLDLLLSIGREQHPHEFAGVLREEGGIIHESTSCPGPRAMIIVQDSSLT